MDKQQTILFTILDNFKDQPFNMADINITLEKLKQKGIVLSPHFINEALDNLLDNGYLIYTEIEDGKWAFKNAKYDLKR